MPEEVKNKNQFIMPAEWEKHSAVWLAWPYDEITFPKRVAIVEQRYCEIIKALAKSEKIKLIILNEEVKLRVQKMLLDFGIDLNQVDFFIANYVDVWTRDYGPIFLTDKDNSLAWVKARYNGYGKAEDPYYGVLLKDNDVFNNQILLSGQKFDLDMVLEGGSIEIDGKGNLITTEQCLLNPNRNPNLTKQQIENNLKKYFGINNIIWLKQGLINDHTDGHIDDVARFVSPSKILCAYEDNVSDENYERLSENFKILENSFDQNGNKFEIIKLPMPHMNYEDGEEDFSGKKAPVSYANFFIGNKTVLVPIFNDKNDEEAISIIKSCFPNREVIGIDCRDLIYGGGTIHCITQQQPE
jgi:agmatine deiminase